MGNNSTYLLLSQLADVSVWALFRFDPNKPFLLIVQSIIIYNVLTLYGLYVYIGLGSQKNKTSMTVQAIGYMALVVGYGLAIVAYGKNSTYPREHYSDVIGIICCCVFALYSFTAYKLGRKYGFGNDV